MKYEFGRSHGAFNILPAIEVIYISGLTLVVSWLAWYAWIVIIKTKEI